MAFLSNIKTPSFLKPVFGEKLFKVESETLKQFPSALRETIEEPKKAFENYLRPIQKERTARRIEENKPLPSFSRLFAEELGKNIGTTAIDFARELTKIPFKVSKTFTYLDKSEQPKWEVPFLGEINSYPELALKREEDLIKQGIPEDTATIASILETGGTAILDVAILGSWLKSGATAVSKLRTPQIHEKMAAWKLLGQPRDATSATKNFHQLSHQFHPFKGGSQSAQKKITQAYNVIKSAGVPTKVELAKARIGMYANKAVTPLTRIMELPQPPATLPFKKLTERAGFIPDEKLVAQQKLPRFGLTMRELPIKPIPPAQSQIKKAHTIARSKLLISEAGKVKPQYRRLAEGITGVKSIKKMTASQADDFIDALQKVSIRFKGGEKLPPIIPETKAVVPKDFFKREFKEPTLAKIFTPSDRYALHLGVYDFLEPAVKAKTRLEVERADLFKWLDNMEKEVLKKEGVPTIKRIYANLVNKPTEAHEKWFDLLDKHETAKGAGLTGAEANIFNEMRGFTKTMLERTNEIRTKAGLDPIRDLKGYVTHLRDVFTRAEIKEKYPMGEELKYVLDFVNPKNIYNPTAMKRMVQEPEKLLKDPFRALKAMTSMDLKQIYLEYPNHLFREQMKAFRDIIPASTRKWAELYMKEVIKGFPTKLDNMTNTTLNSLGVTKTIDLALKPFGRKLGTNPVKQVSGVISRLIHDSTIWGRAKLPIRNLTQRMMSLGLYDSKSFAKGLLPANKELKTLIKNSDFYKISNKQFMEALPKSAFGKLERIGFVPYGKSHISNVNSAMKTAYHASKELATNPKHKDLGWTMDDVMKEMEFGANTTQFWYNLMGMPEIYRSGGTRLLGVLQSWWQNYFFKFWREMITRGFTGKTGWGKPIPTKWRLGAIRHIISSLTFIEGTRRAFGLDYSRVALLGVFPAYMSPPGQITAGLYKYLVADNEYQKKEAKWQISGSWKAMVPGSMAWRDYSNAWETSNLKELFFYTEKKPEKNKGYEIDWSRELESASGGKIDWEKELAK